MNMKYNRFASACLAVCAVFSGPNIAAAATCEVQMQIAGEAKTLSRYLDDDGTFSFQIYTSEASSDVTADFYWRHVPGSGRVVMPSLDIGFNKQGFKKLPRGSYFTLDGTGPSGDPVQKVMQRIGDDPIFNDIKIQSADLLATFSASGALKLQLMLPAKKGSKKPPKMLTQGTLDMALLRQEIAAFGPADILLDTKHQNFEKECSDS